MTMLQKILAINLSNSYSYFLGSIELFSDLYLAKYLVTLAKLFFPYEYFKNQ